MNVDDPLKPINEIFKADRDFYNETIKDRHSALSEIVLNTTVPPKVAQLIETAKNLSLYSYYAYRFHQPAELFGFIALELALKERARAEGIVKKSLTFKWLIEYAIENTWIDFRTDPDLIRKATEYARRANSYELFCSLDGVASLLEPTSEQISEQLKNLASEDRLKNILHSNRQLRNALAHDYGYLAPTSIKSLKDIVYIINQLFDD